MEGYQYIDQAIRNYAYSLLREQGIDLSDRIFCVPKTGTDLELPDKEYVLVRGPEILLTCEYRGVHGQAFTVSPRSFSGSLEDVLQLNLSLLRNRGIFYAALNAVFRYLGLINKTMHCKGGEAEKCGWILAEYLVKKYGIGARVLHVGYQPGHAKYLSLLLKDNVLITDLRSDTVWRIKYDRLVYDGLFDKTYIAVSMAVLVTASSIVNKSFWKIIGQAHMLGKDVYVYGVSAPAVTYFINKFTPFKTETFCPYSK